MNNYVIIGAGQTGRGYAARFLAEKNIKNITFIDNNKQLVQTMQEDKHYSIHFYHKDRTPVIISDFKVCQTYSYEAREAISNADVIFVSVGEQNLKDVAQQLFEALNPTKLSTIMTFENGINPAKVLRNHLIALGTPEVYEVTQTCIFCSTVNVIDTRLDILSQNENNMNYDCDNTTKEFDFIGAHPVCNFEMFLQRKVYTYNSLAGLISYLGYVKNYKIYADAANDEEISKIMEILLYDLDKGLADYFGKTIEEQHAFALKAIDKFKDYKIIDYVIKNGRAAKRKISPTERIMAPIRILQERNCDTKILELVAAACLVYWQEQQYNGAEVVLEKDIIETFAEINSLDTNSELCKNVKKYYDAIMSSRNHLSLMEVLK